MRPGGRGRSTVENRRVERGDAVDLGRRDVEPLGDVVQPATADPADPVVEGVQRRQQQVPLGPRSRPPRRDVVPPGRDRRPAPTGGAEHGVDGRALVGGGRRAGERGPSGPAAAAAVAASAACRSGPRWP